MKIRVTEKKQATKKAKKEITEIQKNIEEINKKLRNLNKLKTKQRNKQGSQ